jgi:two-component system sensor kinase FixL
MLEHTHMMTVYLDAQFNFVWVNRAYAETCRHEPSFFPGKNHFELYPHEENKAMFQRVVDTGEPFFVVAKPFEFPDQPERGVTCWDWSLVPTTDAAGKVTGIVFTLAEVTERKRAEEEWQKLECALRYLAEGVSVTTGEKFFQFFAEYLAKTLNADHAFIGELVEGAKETVRTIAVWSCGKFVDNFDYSLAGTPCENVVARSVCSYPRNVQKLFPQDKLLEELNVESYVGAPLFDSEHKPLGIVAVLDGRPLKNAKLAEWMMQIFGARASAELERSSVEEALRESERKYRVLTESALTGIFIQREGKYVFVNNRFAEIHGYRPEDLIGRNCRELVPETERGQAAERAVCESHDKDSSDIREVPRLTRDGRIIWCEMLTTTIDYLGKPAIMGNMVDITGRKEAEGRAQQHQLELNRVYRASTVGEMASAVAHELNQPLCAILNYAEGCMRIMKNESVDLPDVSNAVKEIAGQTYRAGEIIRHLKSLIARREPQVSEVDVNELIGGVVALIGTEAMQSNVAVQLQFETIPPVLGDRIQLEQVVLNLVRNGFEAMSKPETSVRRLTIGTKIKCPGFIEVAVSDTGTGISPEIAGSIFDSFFTTKTGGLGIGLPLSRSIIRSHGGELWGESNAGAGATFYFTMPFMETSHGET